MENTDGIIKVRAFEKPYILVTFSMWDVVSIAKNEDSGKTAISLSNGERFTVKELDETDMSSIETVMYCNHQSKLRSAGIRS